MKPRLKRLLQLLRRGHLYAGLLMLPWVALYGVTAFLFNHPTAFSDQVAVEFGRDALADTPMASPPAPAEAAGHVVDALRARAPEGVSYSLAEPSGAKYTREFAFATSRVGDKDVSMLIDVTGAGGSARVKAVEPTADPAPFALAGRGRPQVERPRGDALIITDPLHERVKASLPVAMARVGVEVGDITVTSVPDLTFLMSDGAKAWRVTANTMTGAVTGKAADAESGQELSTRRFLTRLHLAHGYPGEVNARWAWAVIVDAMAFIMVFWAVSGILMWWQIKATRRLGLVVVLMSATAALFVGFAMHEVIAGR